MNNIRKLLMGAALATATAAAWASPFTVLTEADIAGSRNLLNHGHLTLTHGDNWGIERRLVTPLGTLYDFCIQIEAPSMDNSGTRVYSGLDATREDNTTPWIAAIDRGSLAALFSNVLPTLATADAATFDLYISALQELVWEIQIDPTINLTAGGFILDPNDPSYGIAVNWAQNITNGTWTDQGGVAYYYLDPANNGQDRLAVGPKQNDPAPVPEPGSVGLLAAGLLLLSGWWRRRERTRT